MGAMLGACGPFGDLVYLKRFCGHFSFYLSTRNLLASSFGDLAQPEPIHRLNIQAAFTGCAIVTLEIAWSERFMFCDIPLRGLATPRAIFQNIIC